MLTIEIAQGVQICLPEQLSHISTYVFLEQENWFEDEAEFVVRTAEPGSRMLDIGSSFGFYSLNYAKAAGPNSCVWAFEPTPAVCELFRESIRLNQFHQIQLIESAVGADVGRCKLFSGHSSELNSISAAQGSIDVAIAPLDLLAPELGFGAVDLVKLDVEGHEAAVIAGGRSFFARQSPLVMLEIKAADAVDFSAASMLEELGYSLYRLVPQLGVLTPFAKDSPDSYLLNVFACKADRASRLRERGLLCTAFVGERAIASVRDVAAALAAIPVFAPHAAFFDTWLDSTPAHDPYVLLLRHWVTSQNSTASIAARCAALESAAALSRTVARGPASPAQRLTAARALRSWGDRGIAVHVLNQILPSVLHAARIDIDAPFFPPLASYESWVADSGNWVNSSVVESLALWSSFGSYWGEPTQTSCSDLLSSFGRCTPLFERRRQLRRIIQGLQVGPQPHPVLAAKSFENRNPEFWCRNLASQKTDED